MSHKSGHYNIEGEGGFLTRGVYDYTDLGFIRLSGGYGMGDNYFDRVSKGGFYFTPDDTNNSFVRNKGFRFWIVPIDTTKSYTNDQLLALPLSERNTQAENILNDHTSSGHALDVWNKWSNPPGSQINVDNIFNPAATGGRWKSQQEMLDELNDIRADSVDFNKTRYRERLEEPGFSLHKLPIPEAYLSGEIELTLEVINKAKEDVLGQVFPKYPTRSEVDLDALVADAANDFEATYYSATGSLPENAESWVRHNMFYNFEVDEKTKQGKQVFFRKGEMDTYNSIGVDVATNYSNNLTSSPIVITKDDYFWQGIIAGEDAGVIPTFIRDSMDTFTNEDLSDEQRLDAATVLLDKLGISPRIAAMSIGTADPVAIVENMLGTWSYDYWTALAPSIDDAKNSNSPVNYLTAMSTGNFEVAPGVMLEAAELYPRLSNVVTPGGNRIDLLGEHDLWNAFAQKNWDYTKSLKTNVENLLASTSYSLEGFEFELDPGSSEWEILTENGRFTTGTVESVVREEINNLVDFLVNDTEAGAGYRAELLGDGASTESAFNIFKALTFMNGPNGEKFIEKVRDILAVDETASWANLMQDPVEREKAAKKYLSLLGEVHAASDGTDPGYIAEDWRELMPVVFQYSSFDAMRKDDALRERVLASWRQNRKERPISSSEIGTTSGRKDLLDALADDLIRPENWVAWTNASEEDKFAVYALMEEKQYGTHAEMLSDPEFQNAVSGVIATGQNTYLSTQATDFAKNRTAHITSHLRETGIINSNTSPELYDFLTTNVIPDIALQAEIAGVTDTASLNSIIARTIGSSPQEYNAFIARIDPSGPPTAPGMPGYAPPRGVPEPEPAPAFDLRGMTPALLKIAEERPEYATWLQGQMQGTEFQQAWAAASRPARTFDEEQYEEEMGLSDEERAAGITAPGAGIDYMATFPGSPGQIPSPWVTDEVPAAEAPPVEYPEFEGRPASDQPEAPAEAPAPPPAEIIPPDETPQEKHDREQAARSPKERLSILMGGARDRATTVTPGMTQEEFFESRLPGFEDQFKLTGAFQEAENRRLRERRRLLATGRGGGGRAFSVFRRGRR